MSKEISMSDQAVTVTICARCGVAFKSKPDNFISEDLENEIANHQIRCLVVGDHVHWENPDDPSRLWIEGEVIRLRGGADNVITIQPTATSHAFDPTSATSVGTNRSTVRRIPAPANVPTVHVPVCCGKPMRKTAMGDGWICDVIIDGVWCERYQGPNGARTVEQWWRYGEDRVPAWKRALGPTYLPDMPGRCQRCNNDPCRCDPLDVVVPDGKATLRSLLAADEAMRREGAVAFPFSPTQRAAVSAHWSAQLRARVAAQREADRVRVVVDQHDAEDMPW